MASKRKVIGGSNFVRKVRKHQQLPPLRSQHKRQKQRNVFLSRKIFVQPRDYSPLPRKSQRFWLTYLPILEWTWKKQLCRKPLRDNSVTFWPSMSTSCKKLATTQKLQVMDSQLCLTTSNFLVAAFDYTRYATPAPVVGTSELHALGK